MASRNSRRPLGFESLEDRRLLTVSASVSAGLLTVSLSAASDSATISATGTSSGGVQNMVVNGTLESGVSSIVVNFNAANQTTTFGTTGSPALLIGGALTVNDAGNSTGETLTFANFTSETYSFGSAAIWTSQTANVGSVAINQSLTASAGTLTIGTGTATTSPAVTFGGTGTVSATGGDIDISAGSSLAIATPLSDSSGTVRLVAGTGISQTSTITASNLSATAATSGNVVLEGNNAVSGTIAFSTTAATYSANNGISFNDNTTAATVGATTTAGSFAAVTGISATDGDVNLKGAGLTINSPITASAGAVRLIETAAISQGSGGVVTAASLSITGSGTSPNAVLEASNAVTTLAAKNTVSASALSFNDNTTAATVGTVAAASATLDTGSLFNAGVTGITTTNGDVNLKSHGLTINQAIAAGTGIVRFVEAGGVTQATPGTITAGSLSTSSSVSSNVILELANSVGTLAASASTSPSALSFNNGANALIDGAVAAESAALDPSALFAAVSGIATNAGDLNLKSAGLTINQALNAGITSNIRLVETGAVSQASGATAPLTASGMSVTTTTGNVLLEGTFNFVTAAFAVSDTAAGGVVELNNGGTTVSSVAAATSTIDPSGLFGVVTGITTSNGDVNLAGNSLTINNPIAAGTGNVRLVESGAVSQVTAGTITAGGLSLSNASGNTLLEAANAVGTLAAKNTTSASALSFSDGTTALTIGSIAAASATVDPSGLFAVLTGVTTTNGDANLKSSGLTINTPIAVGTGTVRLVEAGAVSQIAAGTITASSLGITITGFNVVLEATNAVGTLASTASASPSALTLNNGATALIIGSVAAETATLDPSGVFNTAINGVSTDSSATLDTGDIDLKTGALSINNALSSGILSAVRVVATGALSENASGLIRGNFSATTTTGSVVLENNVLTGTIAITDTAAGAAVTYGDTFSVTVSSVVAASSTLDPSGIFGAVSGISTNNGDVNLDGNGVAISNAIAAGTGIVRVVASGAVSQSAAVTAAALSISTTGILGSAVLESTNAVGTLAFTTTGSGDAVTLNDGTTALTVGSVAAATAAEDPNSFFGAVTGITTTNADVDLKSSTLAVSSPIATGSGNVRFVASGAVSQATAGTITSTGGLSASTTTGSILLESNNSIGTLAAKDTASTASGVSFNNNTNALIVGSVAAASAANDPSGLFAVLAGITTTTGNGDANLKSAASTVNNPIATGSGNVRLVAGGAVGQATAGTITTTSGLSVSTTTGSIILEANNSAATLATNDTASGGAVSFSNNTTALTIGSVAAAAAAIDPSSLFQTVVTGVTTNGGDANLKSGGLSIGQSIAAGAGNVRLVESGSVGESGSGIVTAAGLAMSNSAGNVVLELGSNVGTLAVSNSGASGYVTFSNGSNALTIGSIAAAAAAADPSSLFSAVTGMTTSNGDVNLVSSGLTINQAIAVGTGNVRLHEAGNETQAAAGTITAGALGIANSSGSTVLEAANSVGTLAANSTAGNGPLTFNNGTSALTIGTVAAASSAADPSALFASITGATITAGDLDLQSGGLTINQAIAAGTSNVRLIESGSVTQAAAGTITAAGLSLSSSNGAAVLESANNVGTLAGKFTGNGNALTLNDGTNALSIGSIAAAAAAVDPNSLFAAVTGITTASGDLNLKGAGLSITSAVSIGTGNVRLAESGNVSQTSSANLTAAGLSATVSAGNVVLESTGNQISTLAASNTTSGGAFTINDSAPAGATVGVVAAAGAGADPSGLFSSVTGITTTNGDVNLKSSGLTINSTINAGTANIRLVETGTITPSASITAGGLSVSDSTSNSVLEFPSAIIGTFAASNTASGGAVAFSGDTAALTIGSIAAAASAVDPSSLFPALSGITTSNGLVNLKSGALTVNQPIAAGTGNVHLIAAGSVTQAAAGTITSADLSVSNSIASTVLEASNSVGTLAAANTTAAGALTFNDAANALTIGTIAASPAGDDPNGLFGAVTGITTNNGDVNLKSAGLTISQAIGAGTGNVRLVESGNVSQATAGTITASNFSTMNTGGNTVLEALNDVGARAANNTFAGGATTFNNSTNALIIANVPAAAAAADPNVLFGAVTGVTTNNGDVNLKSGGLTVDQAIGAGTGVVRLVDSGTIVQVSAGVITAAQLSMNVPTSASNIALTSAANAVTTTLAINDPNGASVTFNNPANSPSISATVAAGSAAEDPNALFGAVTGIVGKVPDLTVAKSHTASFFQGDTSDTYSIVVTNSGTGPSAGTVTVTDVVPSGETPTTFAGSGWSTSIAGQTVTATRSDALNASTPYSTLTLTVSIAANASASITNTATVAGGGEVNKSNDSSSDITAISTSDDLAVTKTAPGTVVAGTDMTYTLTISNGGTSASQGVKLGDTLPAGETFVSQSQVSGPAFSLSATGGTVTDTISSLASGASATINVTVLVASSVANGATLSNTATASSTTHDPNLANNSSTATTMVQTSADVAVSLVALESSAAPGSEFAYQVQVTNHGPTDAQGVTLSDTLPASLTFISQSQSSGPTFTLTNAGNSVSDRISSLAAGATSTITIYVRMNAGNANGTTIRDTATVSSTSSDPNLANNSSTANVTVGAAGVAFVVDPFNPATTDVVVTGPAGADSIAITSVGSGRVDVVMNGTTYGPYAPTGRIVVYTGNGNSIVTIGTGITTPAFVFAGSGSDVLMNQGADNSVLVGGGGTDAIQGGSGFNILIAGAGASRLTGGPTGVTSGGSVMIGGATLFQNDEGRLYSMLQDWSSAAAYATRMTELAALGMNAANMIPNTVTDQLFASTGTDWYWNVSGHDTIAGTHGGTVSQG